MCAPAVLTAELGLEGGLLQADLDRSRSCRLLTLLLPLSSDHRNCVCRKPAAAEVSGNGRGEQVAVPGDQDTVNLLASELAISCSTVVSRNADTRNLIPTREGSWRPAQMLLFFCVKRQAGSFCPL